MLPLLPSLLAPGRGLQPFCRAEGLQELMGQWSGGQQPFLENKGLLGYIGLSSVLFSRQFSI